MTKAATTATTATTIMMMLSLERTFVFGFIADAWPTFFLFEHQPAQLLLHATTAYDIIRQCGVEIGKRDFMGAPPS
jgi:hypothetical protein